MTKSVFNPSHTDFTLSPYTGLTRESWLEAAEYMLSGIFQHIDDSEKPVVVPRQETEVTYPHKYDFGYAENEVKAEIFEGLTRSFFIAAPLISENPDTVICGINIRDYYKKHVLYCCTPDHPYYVGDYETLKKQSGDKNPFRAYQQTVETCALVICLDMCKENLWDTYSKEEKDVVAAFLKGFSEAPTVPQNWRLFNMLDMAFLHKEGYEINKNIMNDHAQAILEYYVGDGWYRDGQSFDFYSCWAFNFYAPLWCKWYGYDNLSYVAKKYEEASNKLMETYADYFDKDGFTNMWGRSSIYRFASCSAFDGNMLLRNSAADPGEARRISSGALMQFLGRDDFLWNGLPTMGFYKQFSPLVQGYSCAESPFWMGKAFYCLHLPADHPFWTATEKAATWESLSENGVKETALNGPALCFTNHKNNGTTVLRTGKVCKDKEDKHGMWNYSKLSYNTKYPWESTPVPEVVTGRNDIVSGEVESQQYVLNEFHTDSFLLANTTYWHGLKDGILYRRQYFGYTTKVEYHWIQGMFIADFPVPEGLIRVDKAKLHKCPARLALGSYSFPDNDTKIETKTQGDFEAIILKGKDSQGKPKQLAFTRFVGFNKMGCLRSKNTNPDSEYSLIPYAEATINKLYDASEPYVLISQTITRENHTPFTEDELFPISEIIFTDEAGTGCYGPITIKLKNNTVKVIDFNGIEGSLSI